MEFNVPEDLSSLSLDELSALEAQGVEASSAIAAVAAADLTDEQLDSLELAADGIERVRAELQSRREASAERETRAASARARVAAASEPAEEAVVDPEPEPEPEPEQAVTAAAPARRSSAVSNLAGRPVADAPPSRGAALVAAAPDVPGFSASQNLEGFAGAAKAFTERIKGFPKGPTATKTRIFNRYGVARISRGDFDGLSDGSPEYSGDHMKLLQDASKESRLSGGSLIAAGGWCAPSETLYDLCEMETDDGLIDVPEVNITRGGIRFTQGPDFSAIYDNIGFCQTEAEAEAGLEKPCFDVPCPEFEEVRMDACGLCIRAGILTNVGYPELIERYIRGGMIAHQHKMSAKVINEIATLLGPAEVLTGFDSLTASTLAYVEAVIAGQRQAFRLSLTQTLEVIAPEWLRGAIRADLSIRTGVDLLNVTNAMIDTWFATRGARVQWVYNYQPLATSEANACIDGYPESVELLIYPAGTFVKGVADVINLDAVYDTAGLQENTYTALFFEEGILVAKVCHGGCRISVPVCISGQTGAADLTECQVVGTPLSS